MVEGGTWHWHTALCEAALYADTEYRLFERFPEPVAGKTALLIGHRFSTLLMADWILVLEDGQIVGAGCVTELPARLGRYATLFARQAGHNREHEQP